MVKAVIFDFDGTIADSFEVFVEVLSEAINHKFEKDEIAKLRGLPTRQIMKELGVKKWQLPLIAIKGKRSLGNKMERVEPFAGINEVLKELHGKDYKIYILSTNTNKNINEFLKKYGLDELIDEVYADIGLFAKVKWLKKLMSKHKLSPAECVYVGDETRDIEASHKVDIKCIAVTWGYSTPASLESHKPYALVKKPIGIISAIS